MDPLKQNTVLFVAITPPLYAKLLMKLFVPLMLSTVLPDVEIAPPKFAELLMVCVLILWLVFTFSIVADQRSVSQI